MNRSTKLLAKKLQETRSNPFHVYPNSGTVRQQAEVMLMNLQIILNSVPEGEDVPPWVNMLISQANAKIQSVSNYVSYYKDE